MARSTRMSLATWLLTAGLAPEALGAQAITQTVVATVDGAKSHSTHVWLIEDGKFHLTVTAERGEAHFVFNGRTFYACGKVEGDQLAALAKEGVKDQKALASLKGGACQVVPSNFMVRFYLSPMAAVESVDVTDGLKLTLTMTDYATGATKAGGKCDGMALGRKYTLAKRDGEDAKAGHAVVEAVEEELCTDEGVEWRKGLWPEVAKAVMRQPHGRELLAQLKKDLGSVAGFATTAQIQHKTSEAGGKAHTARFEVKTTSQKAVEADATAFRPPTGYQIFSPEDMVAGVAPGGAAPKDQGGLTKDANAFDLMRSAFFCAIASQFICIGGQ